MIRAFVVLSTLLGNANTHLVNYFDFIKYFNDLSL